jgi:hypothetical protein
LGGEVTFETDTRRARLISDLEAARGEFHAMVASISEQGWTEPSRNPGWTNGQLLFHVLLGFILVLPLAGILVFFGHLPLDYAPGSLLGPSTSRLRSSIESMRSALGPELACSAGRR